MCPFSLESWEDAMHFDQTKKRISSKQLPLCVTIHACIDFYRSSLLSTAISSFQRCVYIHVYRYMDPSAFTIKTAFYKVTIRSYLRTENSVPKWTKMKVMYSHCRPANDNFCQFWQEIVHANSYVTCTKQTVHKECPLFLLSNTWVKLSVEQSITPTSSLTWSSFGNSHALVSWYRNGRPRYAGRLLEEHGPRNDRLESLSI